MDPDARSTFKNGGGYKPILRNEAIGVPDGDGLRDICPPPKKKTDANCAFWDSVVGFFSLFFCNWSAIKEVHDANDAFWNHFQPIACFFLFSLYYFEKGVAIKIAIWRGIWFRSFSLYIEGLCHYMVSRGISLRYSFFLFVKKCFHNKRERLH